MSITVHLILKAHIDPVRLWPWQAGTDEVLATCRSACGLLDRHREIVGGWWIQPDCKKRQAAMFNYPLHSADWTRRMPARNPMQINTHAPQITTGNASGPSV